MKVLITGASGGIGSATAALFLEQGHAVVGLDVLPSPFEHENYTHIVADICGELPPVGGINILINNAGVQDSGRDIEVNLRGTMRVTETYGMKTSVSSILFIASASASTGAEFPEYCASKGGTVSYMKNVALRAAKWGATVNSLSPGGVTTPLNDRVMNSAAKWRAIMRETPLKKWASPEEIARWAYFLTVVNRSMTAQDIVIDNGESARANFIW